MYKKFYSHFLNNTKGQLYLTAHSHHFWPDVTLEAQNQYWFDSASLIDNKWDYFFNNIIPDTQKLIADRIGISNPEQLTFASNTHEFVNRLFSCLSSKARVLSTDSEFYSFARQSQRLQEEGLIEWHQISTEPFINFTDRILETIKSVQFDLIFLSRVFFNSGFVFHDLDKVKAQVEQYQSTSCLVVIDDYHGFLAVPLIFKSLEDRFFYLSGSYKYAGAGEGCCFLVSPKNCALRPRNTGWFASFETLSSFTASSSVPYSSNGYRFSGATQDYTALYRLRSVLLLLARENIRTQDIHQHVQSLQKIFLLILEEKKSSLFKNATLLHSDFNSLGHFLTFILPNEAETMALSEALKQKRIHTDFRKNRMRCGFGLYHEPRDLEKFLVFI